MAAHHDPFLKALRSILALGTLVKALNHISEFIDSITIQNKSVQFYSSLKAHSEGHYAEYYANKIVTENVNVLKAYGKIRDQIDPQN